jgi:hypothetical protein
MTTLEEHYKLSRKYYWKSQLWILLMFIGGFLLVYGGVYFDVWKYGAGAAVVWLIYSGYIVSSAMSKSRDHECYANGVSEEQLEDIKVDVREKLKHEKRQRELLAEEIARQLKK